MKKLLLSLLLCVILGTYVGRGHASRLLAQGISSAGSAALGVPFSVDSIGLGLLGGKFSVHGLAIGNPAGCSTPHSFRVDRFGVHADLTSFWSDVARIQEIRIRGPEITLEVTPDGTNLGKLMTLLRARQEAPPSTGEGSAPAPSTSQERAPQKKLRIDRVVIEEAKLRIAPSALVATEIVVPLAPITLENLSAGGEPVEFADVLERVFAEITSAAGKQGGLPPHVSQVLRGELDQILPQLLDKKGRKKLERELKDLKDIFKK